LTYGVEFLNELTYIDEVLNFGGSEQWDFLAVGGGIVEVFELFLGLWGWELDGLCNLVKEVLALGIIGGFKVGLVAILRGVGFYVVFDAAILVPKRVTKVDFAKQLPAEP